MFVAVWSYLGHEITDVFAIELATDRLMEAKWFTNNEPTEPDYII
jgi:hypothetical protein